ncbi:C25 family cysteine peptidase [bacterium]|nr:C25 family cysteine peptidase [bacterium]
MIKMILIISSLLGLSVALANKVQGNESSINYSKKRSGHKLSFKLSDYSLSTQSVGNKVYTTIESEAVKTEKKGFAEIPYFNSSVALNSNKDFSLKVVGSSYEDIALDHPLLPSKGVVTRDKNISDIAYTVAPESLTDSFYPASPVVSSSPYIFRNVRGMNVYFYPFSYNAKKNILRVYKSIDVQLVSNSRSSTNALIGKRVSTIEMESIYKSMFINYSGPARSLKVAEHGELLVITTKRDEKAIQPYINWKIQKGFRVIKKVVATGTNVKDLIKEEYKNNKRLLYVQLVGDWDDIKSETGPASAPMDPMLGAVDGNDSYAELMIGRFSSKSASDVTIQVNKTIAYEKNPALTGDWYSAALGIGSAEGNGNGDDGEADYVHLQNIFDTKLEPFTFTTYFDASAPTGKSKKDVLAKINEGVSLINYAGHGSHTAWSTTGFSNKEIKKLKNGSMLPAIVSVACVNGQFHKEWSGDSFAETWLKKENGGAIAVWAATINQPWAPPMRGQDYFNDLLVGGYDYDKGVGKGTNTTEGRTTFGALTVNASHLMYAEANGYSDLDTIQTWTVFGDVTVQLRTAAPTTFDFNYNIASTGQAFTASLSDKSGRAVTDALIAVSQKDKTFYARSDAQGNVEINHKLKKGAYTITVTGFNLNSKVIESYMYNDKTADLADTL